MRTRLFLILICFLVYANAQQYDESEGVFYIRGSYDVTQVWSNAITDAKTSVAADSTYNPTFDYNVVGGSVSLGQGFNNIRAELEGIYISKLAPQTDNAGFYMNTGTIASPAYTRFVNNGVSYMAIMINGYYDLAINNTFMPYFGGGVGASRLEFFTHGDTSITGFNIAMQMKAGVSFPLSRYLIPYIGARAVYLTEKELTVKSEDNLKEAKIKPSYTTYGLEVGALISF